MNGQEVLCEPCNKVWTDRKEVFQPSYRKWTYCPYCGGELTHE